MNKIKEHIKTIHSIECFHCEKVEETESINFLPLFYNNGWRSLYEHTQTSDVPVCESCCAHLKVK